MISIPRSAAVIAATAALLATTLPALADRPGEHPYTLHALHDLRVARAYLRGADERNVMADERSAIVELDQAIGSTRRVARLDGKDLDDVPPIDANLAHRNRLGRALSLERAALRDLSADEDDRAALGWRARARADVRDAIVATERAMRADVRDDHPM